MDIVDLKLAEISPNPYVLMDRDLRLVWMNQAYLAVTMRSREDITDKRMFDAFPADPASESYRQLDESLRHVLDTGEADEIALIRYDIARPDGTMDTRYWSATHTPVTDGDGKLQYILQHTVDVTELHKLRQLRDEMGLVRRAEAIQARNRDLERESERLLEFFRQAPGFVSVLAGEDHVFQMANDAYLELVGRTDIIGQPVRVALPEIVGQGFVDILDGVFASGEIYFGRRQPVILEGNNSPAESRRVLNFVFQPIFDQAENVTGIIVQGYDVTEEIEYEERQVLLIQELNHRVKNTLAVVQSLAQQTFRGIDGAQGALVTYKARLQALAAAHGLLTASSWSPAKVEDVVALTVEAAAGDDRRRVDLQGADFELGPEVALALTMIVHELTTNAIKYGALSNEEGRVTVDWTVAETRMDGEVCDQFSLTWSEAGGPEVTPPDSPGFGTRLIRSGITSKRGTQVDLRYEPGGVVCELRVMLECRDDPGAAPGGVSSPARPD